MISVITFWIWVTIISGLILITPLYIVALLVRRYSMYVVERVYPTAAVRLGMWWNRHMRWDEYASVIFVLAVGLLATLASLTVALVPHHPGGGTTPMVDQVSTISTYLASYTQGYIIVAMILVLVHVLFMKGAKTITRILQALSKLEEK